MVVMPRRKKGLLEISLCRASIPVVLKLNQGNHAEEKLHNTMQDNEREAIEELKAIGAQELRSLLATQEVMTKLFGDPTGKAEERNKRIKIALVEMLNENVKH